MNPLSYLIDRHEVLRTTFTVQDGCPVQIVHPKAPLVLELFDLADTADAHSAALAIFKEEASRPIDLGRLPILRYVAIKVAADEHLVLRSVHTLVADGSSWAIHATELAALYEARLRNMPPPVPREMPLQYADYTV